MTELSRDETMEYLSTIGDLESKVYVWSETMAKENEHMRGILQKKSQAKKEHQNSEKGIEQIHQKYEELKFKYENLLQQSKQELNRQQADFNNFRLLKVLSLTVLICCALLGILVLPMSVWFLDLDRNTVAIVSAALLVFCMLVLSPILVYCIYSKNKLTEKIQNTKQKIELIETTDMERKKNQELSSLVATRTTSQAAYEKLCDEEIECRNRQRMIFENFNLVKESRQKLYDLNLLEERYRTFQSVYTMYDYLKTGRCLTLYGHGGAIDTYEEELKFSRVYGLLMDIRSIAMDINEMQSEICQEARRQTAVLERIEHNSQEIMEYSRETANSVRQTNESLYRIENSLRF